MLPRIVGRTALVSCEVTASCSIRAAARATRRQPRIDRDSRSAAQRIGSGKGPDVCIARSSFWEVSFRACLVSNLGFEFQSCTRRHRIKDPESNARDRSPSHRLGWDENRGASPAASRSPLPALCFVVRVTVFLPCSVRSGWRFHPTRSAWRLLLPGPRKVWRPLLFPAPQQYPEAVGAAVCRARG